MGFELLTPDTSMRAGLTIDYRIRTSLGVPTRWRTEITTYEPPVRFIDLRRAARIALLQLTPAAEKTIGEIVKRRWADVMVTNLKAANGTTDA